jgi:hypothetical protein
MEFQAPIMRRFTIVPVVLITAAVVLVLYQKMIDDGLWPVSVTVRSAAGRPIKAVSAEAMFSRPTAEMELSRLIPPAAARIDNSIYGRVQEPFLGKPLKINVPTSETIHRSLVSNYKRFFQYRGLLVVAEFEDGKLEGRALELPDLRRGRELSVEFP